MNGALPVPETPICSVCGSDLTPDEAEAPTADGSIQCETCWNEGAGAVNARMQRSDLELT